MVLNVRNRKAKEGVFVKHAFKEIAQQLIHFFWHLEHTFANFLKKLEDIVPFERIFASGNVESGTIPKFNLYYLISNN